MSQSNDGCFTTHRIRFVVACCSRKREGQSGADQILEMAAHRRIRTAVPDSLSDARRGTQRGRASWQSPAVWRELASGASADRHGTGLSAEIRRSPQPMLRGSTRWPWGRERSPKRLGRCRSEAWLQGRCRGPGLRPRRARADGNPPSRNSYCTAWLASCLTTNLARA